MPLHARSASIRSAPCCARRRTGWPSCEQNPAAPLQPGAIVFHSIADAAPLPAERIELIDGNDSVLAFENARDWGYTDEQMLALCADPAGGALGRELAEIAGG